MSRYEGLCNSLFTFAGFNLPFNASSVAYLSADSRVNHKYKLPVCPNKV